MTPQTPTVPVGLGTQAGLLGALATFAVAIVAFVQGDRTPEAIAGIVTAGAILYGVVSGRMRQATALTIAAERTAPLPILTKPPAEEPGDEPADPDGDDGVHEATDGDPDAIGEGDPIDEDESRPDPDDEAGR